MTDVAKFKPMTVYVTYLASTPEKVWQALKQAVATKPWLK